MQQPNSEMQMHPCILKIVTTSYNSPGNQQLRLRLDNWWGFTVVAVTRAWGGSQCGKRFIFSNMHLHICILMELHALFSEGVYKPLMIAYHYIIDSVDFIRTAFCSLLGFLFTFFPTLVANTLQYKSLLEHHTLHFRASMILQPLKPTISADLEEKLLMDETDVTS